MTLGLWQHAWLCTELSCVYALCSHLSWTSVTRQVHGFFSRSHDLFTGIADRARSRCPTSFVLPSGTDVDLKSFPQHSVS